MCPKKRDQKLTKPICVPSSIEPPCTNQIHLFRSQKCKCIFFLLYLRCCQSKASKWIFLLFRFNESWPIWLAPTVIICFLACLLHLLDRQVELSIRSDFLWQYKLSSEEEGVDTMRGINKILLENILPAHVAEHYLLRGQGMSGILQDNVI